MTSSFLETLRDEFPKSAVWLTALLSDARGWKRPDSDVRCLSLLSQLCPVAKAALVLTGVAPSLAARQGAAPAQRSARPRRGRRPRQHGPPRPARADVRCVRRRQGEGRVAQVLAGRCESSLSLRRAKPRGATGEWCPCSIVPQLCVENYADERTVAQVDSAEAYETVRTMHLQSAGSELRCVPALSCSSCPSLINTSTPCYLCPTASPMCSPPSSSSSTGAAGQRSRPSRGTRHSRLRRTTARAAAKRRGKRSARRRGTLARGEERERQREGCVVVPRWARHPSACASH